MIDLHHHERFDRIAVDGVTPPRSARFQLRDRITLGDLDPGVSLTIATGMATFVQPRSMQRLPPRSNQEGLNEDRSLTILEELLRRVARARQRLPAARFVV